MVLLIWPIGRIDDHHCIERWLFVLLIWPIGGIDDHHCHREVVVCFVDGLYDGGHIGGIDDHHCILMIICINKTNNHLSI